MPTHHIVARRPRGADRAPIRITDPARLASVLEDAAHILGNASALVMPTTETEVAEVLRSSRAVLPIGAQSSLTGGATPRGEVVLSTARFNRIIRIAGGQAQAQAGVSLADLDAALAAAGGYYPPAPTFTGAFVGGTVSTNAAGAATFKYGTTRDWVDAITVILASGDVLDIHRGHVQAHADGYFQVDLQSGSVRVPIPHYRMPQVRKVSAGYFAAPGMDLIDLFIGAEGTLGVIVDATLRIVVPRPAWCLAFVPVRERTAGIALVRTLRACAEATGVAAIEHLDARCLELAREDELDKKAGVAWPDSTALALLITLELPSGTTAEQAFDQIGRAADPDASDTPLVRFCRTLQDVGAIDNVQIAVSGDARLHQLLAFREGVPASVNDRIARAKHRIDPRIEKTAGDTIVPFDRLEELLSCYDREFGARGLDAAVWGHISDGNLHPNVLARSFADVEAGRTAMRSIGREVIRLGGSPLAEHGVGRNPVKQQLLEEMYGRDGIDQMRAVKRALDPEWKLAPGVLFAPA
jgi:D-lactate dehydrogenase (cytochrome)